MSSIVRRITAIAAVVAFLLSLAALPVQAHDSPYCGYSSQGIIWVAKFNNAWTDSFAHYHTQWHANTITHETHYKTVVCAVLGQPHKWA